MVKSFGCLTTLALAAGIANAAAVCNVECQDEFNNKRWGVDTAATQCKAGYHVDCSGCDFCKDLKAQLPSSVCGLSLCEHKANLSGSGCVVDNGNGKFCDFDGKNGNEKSCVAYRTVEHNQNTRWCAGGSAVKAAAVSPPACLVDAAGHTHVLYQSAQHLSFKCFLSIDRKLCQCTQKHPTHHRGGCMQFESAALGGKVINNAGDCTDSGKD